jgi:hypothetical protein
VNRGKLAQGLAGGRGAPAIDARTGRPAPRVCFETDNRLGEPAACRWFLNWFDDTPWAELKKLLLPEIEREIARREDDNGPEKEIIGGQQSAPPPVYELQDRLATHGPLSQQRQGPHLPAVRLGSVPASQAH